MNGVVFKAVMEAPILFDLLHIFRGRDENNPGNQSIKCQFKVNERHICISFVGSKEYMLVTVKLDTASALFAEYSWTHGSEKYVFFDIAMYDLEQAMITIMNRKIVADEKVVFSFANNAFKLGFRDIETNINVTYSEYLFINSFKLDPTWKQYMMMKRSLITILKKEYLKSMYIRIIKNIEEEAPSMVLYDIPNSEFDLLENTLKGKYPVEFKPDDDGDDDDDDDMDLDDDDDDDDDKNAYCSKEYIASNFYRAKLLGPILNWIGYLLKESDGLVTIGTAHNLPMVLKFDNDSMVGCELILWLSPMTPNDLTPEAILSDLNKLKI